ncbi:3-hydroxyacyl-CoA dehydrogenase family protein [Streptomyces albidoflavus]
MEAGLTQDSLSARGGPAATDLVYASLNRAVAMVEQGYAGRKAVDTAMRLGCGLPVGPFELLAEVGRDTVHAVLSDLHSRIGPITCRARHRSTMFIAASPQAVDSHPAHARAG